MRLVMEDALRQLPAALTATTSTGRPDDAGDLTVNLP